MPFDLTALANAVAAEKTVEASVIALIDQAVAIMTSQAKQLQSLIPTAGNAVDPVALQAIVTAINADAQALTTSQTALAAAVTANTPAPPVPAPPPPPPPPAVP